MKTNSAGEIRTETSITLKSELVLNLGTIFMSSFRTRRLLCKRGRKEPALARERGLKGRCPAWPERGGSKKCALPGPREGPEGKALNRVH